MATLKANGIDIEYELHGPKSGPVVVLIRGLGTQLIYWPLEFYRPMVDARFRVLMFDNRDSGLSSKMDHLGKADLVGLKRNLQRDNPVEAPYDLDDMSNDVVGLLDALGLSQAHIVGNSMGGAIAQTMTEMYPDRVISLTSIMSTSSNPELPSPAQEILETLFSPPKDATDRQGKIADEVRSMLLTGSPGYPITEEYANDLAARAYDRCYHPDGVDRQFAAMRTAGDRRARLRRIRKPTLVVHGSDDVLLPLACGADTAANIRGAEFVEVPGMGHDIPPSLGGKLSAIVLRHIRANTIC